MELTRDRYGRPAYQSGDPQAALYGTPRKETLLRLAESTPAGCFVEFGVYQGGSAWRLAQLATKQNRALHLFDTFSGMPESGEYDVIPIGAHADVSLAEVKRLIPTAIFHVGMFPETMPAEMEPIAFCHIDCDQYASCQHAIRLFLPLLVPGGVMLFDDYNVTPGVKKVVDETFADVQITREGKAYITKLGD